jgi:cytochrome c peroxidase
MRGLQVGAPTAVAFRPNGALLTFYPEAGGITIQDGAVPRGIALTDRPATDTGRRLFHQATTVGLACASCHPEARDDGGVWTFDELGVRRTQNVSGGILARAPYHWGADMPTLHALVDNVFTQRMAGEPVNQDEEIALGKWLDRVPAPRGVVADAAAVARGQELFEAPETGCRSCHTGALYTNNKTANVGLGLIKVPSLVGVGGRAPYMHDGCAATLRDRFGACGGGDAHGHTSQLSAAELDDLIAYLESL